MLGNLKSIFSQEAIAFSMENLPEIKSTIMDNVFPSRINHPMATIGISDLIHTLHTAPLVRRDGSPVPLQEDSVETQFFAPLPIKVQLNVSMSELNDLGIKGMHFSYENYNGIEAWRENKVDMLRLSIRETIEGICSTVLSTGKVSWPVRLGNGRVSTMELDYGSPLTYASSLSTSSTMADVYTLLCQLDDEIKMAGQSGNVEFYAGRDVARLLLNIMHVYTSSVANNSIRMELGQNKIIIGAYIVHFMQEKYRHPITQNLIDKVSPQDLIAVGTDHIGKVYYCAIDSVSANNAALPFHVIPVQKQDDSGFTLIAQCKPLPVRSPKSVCICTALSE